MSVFTHPIADKESENITVSVKVELPLSNCCMRVSRVFWITIISYDLQGPERSVGSSFDGIIITKPITTSDSRTICECFDIGVGVPIFCFYSQKSQDGW